MLTRSEQSAGIDNRIKSPPCPLLQIKVETRPLFQLCGEVSGDNEKYFLFPKVFNYWFYKSWCFNMGGSMVVPSTDEEYHSDMDIAESMVDPQTHEKVGGMKTRTLVMPDFAKQLSVPPRHRGSDPVGRVH